MKFLKKSKQTRSQKAKIKEKTYNKNFTIEFSCQSIFKKLFLTPLLGGLILLSPSLSLAESGTNSRPPSGIPPSLSQPEQAIVEDLIQCISNSFSDEQQESQQTLETTSMKCFYQVIYLDKEGKIRPDAEERLKTLVQITGVPLPTPVRQGQASIQLQKIPNSKLFSLPVTLEGQTQQFILDLGASNSIITNQVAQKLKLQSITIPSELLNYMAVGQNCDQIQATVHPFPKIAVDSATGQGLMGLGLSKFFASENIAGVIGLDFFSGFDVSLNPQTLQLKLSSPSTIKSSAIPLKGKMGLMTTEVYINGQGPFIFLLDTGAEQIVISDKLAQKLNLAKTETTEVTGFCGNEPAYQTRLDKVSIKEHTVNTLDGVIVNTEVLQVLGIDGIIGQNFLNQYQQHWQFGSPNQLGFPETGGLTLSPLTTQ